MSRKIMVLNDIINNLFIYIIQCKYNDGDFPLIEGENKGKGR